MLDLGIVAVVGIGSGRSSLAHHELASTGNPNSGRYVLSKKELIETITQGFPSGWAIALEMATKSCDCVIHLPCRGSIRKRLACNGTQEVEPLF